MSDKTKGLDRLLRKGLAPESEAIERVVHRSLTAGTKGKRNVRFPLALAGLAFAVLVAAFAIVLHEDGPDGQKTVEILTITNVSGEIEVLYPAGRERMIRDRQTLTIFNCNGLVAVFAPIPAARHFIVGGAS